MQAVDQLHIEPEVIERLRLALKGFAPATPENVKVRSGRGHRIRVSPQTLPLAPLPYLVLLAIGCKNLGRGEKLAWAVPFAFEGAYCELSSEKFGLRLFIDKEATGDASEVSAIAGRILSRLNKGQRLLDARVLRPLAMEELRAGRVILRNQYYQLRETYEYFREGAQLAYAGKGRANRPNRIFALEAEAFHNTIAMVGAYFSLLEHLLVLVTPFLDSTLVGQDLLDLIGDKWSTKFRKTLGVDDPIAKRFHDEFRRISEEYRNTFAHGGFDKSRATMGFRIPGVGWLPAMLSDIRDSPHFNFVPADQTDYGKICALFDEFDGWVESVAAVHGMIWVKAGLDVRFDEEFRADLLRSLDDDTYMEFVESTSGLVDLHTNMDY